MTTISGPSLGLLARDDRPVLRPPSRSYCLSPPLPRLRRAHSAIWVRHHEWGVQGGIRAYRFGTTRDRSTSHLRHEPRPPRKGSRPYKRPIAVGNCGAESGYDF